MRRGIAASTHNWKRQTKKWIRCAHGTMTKKKKLKQLSKKKKVKFHKAQEMPAEIQSALPPQQAVTTPSDGQAKLPKLTITKFDGTYMNWPQFWGQFTETIDKTNVQPITKFSYLRELLDFKVKRTI